jgi:hypothetical protein
LAQASQGAVKHPFVVIASNGNDIVLPEQLAASIDISRTVNDVAHAEQLVHTQVT